MPIIINEIEINVEVGSGGNNTPGAAAAPETLKESIIKECVEKILEILNLKNER